MPSRYGVEVTVTDTEHQPLREFGSQAMGKAMHLSKIVSTRIEAKDGLQFYVHVKPQYPFPLSQNEIKYDAHEINRVDDMFTNATPLGNVPYDLRRPVRFNENTAIEDQISTREGSRSSPLLAESSGDKKAKQGKSGRGPTDLPTSASEDPSRAGKKPSSTEAINQIPGLDISHQTRSARSRPTHPPFDLTASIFIDGREKPEARQVIYLNPDNPKFDVGGFCFTGRWVAPSSDPTSAQKTAQISIRNWVFKSIPVSVDDLTTCMSICSTSDNSGNIVSEEDRDLEDLNAALSRETLDAKARPKPGQIEVRIRRIIAGIAVSTVPFKPYYYAGADEEPDLRKGELGDDCTHKTALRTKRDRNGRDEMVRLNTVPWKPYKKGEDIYVRFVFTYTHRGKLVKLGLCDEAGQPTLLGRVHVPDVLHAGITGVRKREQDDVQAEAEEGPAIKQETPLGRSGPVAQKHTRSRPAPETRSQKTVAHKQEAADSDSSEEL